MRSAGPACRRGRRAAGAGEEWGGRGEANCGGIASAVRARRLDLSLEEEKLNFFDEEDGALGVESCCFAWRAPAPAHVPDPVLPLCPPPPWEGVLLPPSKKRASSSSGTSGSAPLLPPAAPVPVPPVPARVQSGSVRSSPERAVLA